MALALAMAAKAYKNINILFRLKFAYMICDTDNTGYLPKDEISIILKANFLAQAATTQDIKRRVDKIFEKAGVKETISFAQFVEVTRKEKGLVFPSYSLMETLQENA